MLNLQPVFCILHFSLHFFQLCLHVLSCVH
jgi:hypothetical protein